MRIGYMRVSKADGSQCLDLQRNALLESGVTSDRIYEDLASGRHDARPGLEACLKALQPGNTLVIWKLDRLGRSLKDLVNLVEGLNERGINLKVLTGQGAQIDTTTSSGRLILLCHIDHPLPGAIEKGGGSGRRSRAEPQSRGEEETQKKKDLAQRRKDAKKEWLINDIPSLEITRFAGSSEVAMWPQRERI